jgi:hypothetical protein
MFDGFAAFLYFLSSYKIKYMAGLLMKKQLIMLK